MNKIPNWIRYIIAIPLGVLGSIIFYFIGYFTSLWVASPDSLFFKFYSWIYGNGLNIVLALYFMDLVLPKYRNHFNITISLLYGAVIVFGFSTIILGVIPFTWSYLLSGLFNILCLIIYNIYAIKNPDELYQIEK